MYKTKEYTFGVDVIKNYYIDEKIVASQYDRTFFFNDYESDEEVKEAAQRWCNIWSGEEWQLGADTTELDDRCDLLPCCPVENGTNDFECDLVCAKYNCGAVLVMCPECKTRYYDSSGCWQCGHNSPTACDCHSK